MGKKKIIPSKLPPEVYNELEQIVGNKYVSQDRATVETYSKLSIDADGMLKKHMKDPSSIPACVILPGSTEDIQSIVRLANKYKIPFLPFTNGQMLSAPTMPVPTICIHLSRMNKVISIDESNMTATIEPYVDYAQVIAEAVKKELWIGGTPLSTTLCKLSSQTALAGIWQTSKKYGLLGRNIVSLTVVLPDGEIMKTGGASISGVKNFWEYGPGPDLFSLIRGSVGTTGIITELTVKLHPWAGGKDMPEPPAGRPCIHNYHEPKFDTAPPPDKYRLFWIEFPDYNTEIKAFREIAHSGIGIGLNATGVYNSYYCSQTQEMTEQRMKNSFFPPWNLYVICAGIVSDKQIVYEEKVLREIADEYHGTFLSSKYKPDVIEALAPWNLDCFRHVTGYRMSRRNYAGSMFGGGAPELAKNHSRIWKDALRTFGETYITDRGGVDNTVFIYAVDPAGRFNLTETDIYPDPMDPDALKRGIAIMIYGVVKNISLKNMPLGFGLSIEPFTSFFPEQGPNAHLLFRKLRGVFDPNCVISPGRQVFTEEELKAFPKEMADGIKTIRKLVKLSPALGRMLWVAGGFLTKMKSRLNRGTRVN
jgi:hypothetical protein